MDKECDNCLCHLHICKAECCRQFRMLLPEGVEIVEGMRISWESEDKDMLHYYKLHNIYVEGKLCSFYAINFKQKGNMLYVLEKCSALNDDNTCSLHGTEEQPKVCFYPNKEGKVDKIYYTKNCIYKK